MGDRASGLSIRNESGESISQRDFAGGGVSVASGMLSDNGRAVGILQIIGEEFSRRVGMETGENVNRLAEETRPGDIRGCPLLVLMNLSAVPFFHRGKLRLLFEKIA